ATLTIQKAESVIIADSMQFYVFDGTEKRVIAQLSHQETELIIKPYNSFVMPGIYKIEIFSIETNNFLKASKRITLNIEQASFANIELNDKTIIYDGRPHSIEATNQPN